MRLPRLSPAAFRRITFLATLALAFIIVTGGAVRLTGSGLGCPDWPTCAEDRVVAPWEYHAMVEFVNRTITGLVSVAVILAVLGSLLRRPRRRDLTWLSLGLVGGVVGQIVLGGFTVLFHLWPPLVMGHFVLSMAILADAVVLHHRAGRPDGPPTGETGVTVDPATAGPVVDRPLLLLGRLVLAATALAILLGTVVTGTGPHGGDEDVDRLPFFLPDVARLHGISVVLLLVVVLVTLWRLRGDGAPAGLLRRGELLLGVLVAQAAVGYVQYFTGVPALLVGVHIAGATAVWAMTIHFLLGFHAPRQALPGDTAEPGDEARPARL
ncbi:MAG TPA: COX15/CtaA family protein, partial [Acidimicrobiales bacterium]|nr:COX15/CtaA family protein [Acidimicrobiales bacterium]